MKYTKIYCIETYHSSYCSFFKDKLYTTKIDNDFYTSIPNNKHISRTFIIDNKGNSFEFDNDSPFSRNTYPKYFINMSEVRKQKLIKLNEKIY